MKLHDLTRVQALADLRERLKYTTEEGRLRGLYRTERRSENVGDITFRAHFLVATDDLKEEIRALIISHITKRIEAIEQDLRILGVEPDDNG